MSTIDREPEARAARLHVPSLQEIFWGPLATRIRRIAQWRRRGALGKAHAEVRRAMKFEPLEPRLLLSADLAPQTSEALGAGLGLLGARVDNFITSDAAFDAHVPLLYKIETDPVTQAAVNEAPTAGDLLSVPVDANGDGDVNKLIFSDSDNDELVLQSLDQNGNNDGTVDAGEFLKGFFFDKVTQFLNSAAPADTQDVADFLTDSLFPYNFFDPLDQTLDQLSGAYNVDFEVVDAHVADTTQNPDAEATFSVGFRLTITHDMPIDLGLGADGLKLLPFTGSSSDPQPVTVPVTSTLDFGFDFGVFTGGQDPADINAFDFFVRKADPLNTNVSAANSDFGFKLNVGFLGTTVQHASFDLEADVQTTLLDPNDPDALGFSDSQLGVEETSGIVTSADPVPDANLMHDVGFFLRIGNVGITTPVYVADNDAGSLAALESDIETALANANLDGLIDADIVGGHVRFSLVPTTDTPLNFANESYSGTGVLQATPDGDGANSFEYNSDQTFLLSVGGALSHLVRVHFPDPAIEDVGFGEMQDANILPAVIAPSDGPADGVLGADTTLNITVVTDDGTERSEAVTVDSDDTDGTNGAANSSLSDLAADINAALPGSISGLIHAFVFGGTKIGFYRTDGSVSAITVATGANSGELGFTSGAATTLRLNASNTIQNVDLGDDAHLKVEVKVDTGSGTSTTTYSVTVPDNDRSNPNDLATDIDTALDNAMGANRIDAIAVPVSGGHRIVLVAHDDSVLAFSITTINENIDDLVADVNHALANAGLGGQVSASNAGGDLRLTAAGGKSLEISKTLTFDAGVTYTELLPPFFGGTPDSGLFLADVGAGTSHAEFELPVHVNPGLEDVHNDPGHDWDPADVSIVANFNPLPSDDDSDPVAFYDTSAKRFDLKLTLDPTMENQDTQVAVPSSGSLTNEIRLVNMAELLNFNVVTAENMVGLLQSLGTALQQISNSALFAGYDIPLAAAALSGLLNYTDKKNGTGLIDKLIFDGGGDGIDGSEPDTNRLLKKVTFEGTSYLVPAFVTAQELGAKLDELLPAPLTGDGGINPGYDTDSNQLTYSVDLLADSDTTVTIDKPFEYDVPLNPFAKLTVDTAAAPEDKVVTLEGRTGLGMTFGVDLSPPGAVIDEDTLLSKLNGGADSGLDAASTGVHFKPEQAITGTVDIPTVPAPGGDDPTPLPPIYQLWGDAVFDLSINGGAPVEVTVPAASTLNRSMGDLVQDVNNALAAAGVFDQVEADYDGSRLVLSAKEGDDATSFSITYSNIFALAQLGLANGATSNQDDFVITARDGTTYGIVLDGLPADPTVGDVIDAVNLQTGGVVTASLNATHTGLRLVDSSGGSGQFAVDSVNASPALLDLGLTLAGDANDKMQDRFGDGDPNLIEGGALNQIHLDQRFFVRDAAMRLDGLTLTTPDGGVPGEALFGIVGVDTHFSGTMYAEVNAALQNPTEEGPADQVSLAQLFNQTDAVGDPVVSKAREIAYTPFFGSIAAGKVVTGGNSGATALVVAVDDANHRLILAHVQGSFQGGEGLVQGINAWIADGADAEMDNFGDFTLDVDVQDGFGELGFGPGFASLDGASYVVPVALTGFGIPLKPGIPGDPAAMPPVPAVPAVPAVPPTTSLDLSGIGDLAAFEDLDYSSLQGALDGLEALLRDVDANFALLNTKLPAINRSVSDLLSLIDGFAHSVDNADGVLAAAQGVLEQSLAPPPSYEVDQSLDLPAPRLQDIPRLLRGAFGLPNGVDPDSTDAVNWVRLDFDSANHMLMGRLSLEQTLSTKLGLDIEVGGDLPNLTSGGVLEVAGLLDVNLHFGIDLDAPSNAYVYDDSTIAASLDVVGEGQEYISGEDGLGLVFYSSIGPLAVLIQDGDANIHVAFDLPGLELGSSHRKLLGDPALGYAGFADFKPAHVSQDSVDIVLPMFYGGEGPNDFLGAFGAKGSLGVGLTITTPDFTPLADDIGDGTIPFDPFDNIQLAIDTVNVYLENLSDEISASVLNTKLPFAGNQLADQLFIEEFRTTLVRALKEGIANAVNPDPDTIVQDLLNGVFGTGGALHGYLQPGSLVYSDSLGGDVNTRYRQWNFTLHRVDSVTLNDFDIGIPGLTFDLDTPVTVNFDWTMDLGFGVNFGKGAYIDVSDSKEVDLELDITLPGGGHDGQLGFLKVNETDPGNDTGVHVEFDVDAQNGAGGSQLAFAEIGNLLPVATVSGGPAGGATDAVTLHLESQTTPGLPTLKTNLLIDWALATTSVGGLTDGDAVTPGIEKIALNDIELNSGSVAEQLLGPLFDDVKQFIDPFMPVVDTLTAPIPILSDLAGEPFTLIDLAGVFGDVDPAFLDTVSDILDVIGAIGDFIDAPWLPLGDLTLYDTNPADPVSNFDPTDPNATIADVGSLLDLTPGSVTPGLTHDSSNDPGSYNYLIEHNDFLYAIKHETLAQGLTMPILVDPLQGMKLLLGDPTATLVEYQLQPLEVGFEYGQVFPVWGPLAVEIEIGFNFGLDLHSVGFDTYGYKRYADGGFRNPEVIFDGFFLNDRNEDGVDAPEVTMEFALTGAAELNLGIASAGVKGGIDASIFFDWHDSIPDGHVHLSEIAGNVVANDGNPLAAFDVGGELTFQLAAFLKILSFEKDFPITPETTLYSYEDSSSRDPILATKLGGGVLQLNMGPNAKDRLNGDVSDGSEEFYVRNLGGGDVKVWSTKLGIDQGSGQTYHGVTHIVGLGGQGDDKIHLLDFDGSGITGDFDGGAGDDYIAFEGSTASTSAPGSRIVGGLGNDTLIGGDANDVIVGGQGMDTIVGGGGHDILFGDDGTVGDTYITSRIGANDGADTIYGGAGDDVIIGAGGDDTLDGGDDADVIIGDGGRFAYTKTGSGDAAHVNVAALRPAGVYPFVPTPISSYKDPAQISSEIDAIYDGVAAEFTAVDFGFGGNDDIQGGDGDDIILGGSGDDTVHGGAGDDIILGGKGFDDLHGGTNDDTIFGGDQADTIAGDDGADVISGGAGGDLIHGNAGNDVMKGDTGADVMYGDAGDDQVFGNTEPDVLFGGIGNDLVVGGTSNDIMFGDDGIVAKLDPSDGSGYRVIGIGNPALITGAFYDGDKRTVDLIVTDVVTGDGNDVMSGDAGDDIMLGGGGNDLMGGDVDPRLPSGGSDTPVNEDVLIGDGGKITFDQRYFRSIETVPGPDTTGTPFNDVIYGDNGNDYIFGGRGNDFLFGGHGKAVDVPTETVGAFRGATDPGADDNDIIVGDNGEMLFAEDAITHRSGVLSVVRTTDTTEDTGGHEYAEGELGDDVIFGGTNASVDVLYGNEGNDVILGDNGELNWDNDGLHDLSTLDLIRSYRDKVGGEDHISGNAGDDVLIGGTGGDLMYGDDATASAGAADGEDIMLGDNADILLVGNVGRLKVRVADMSVGTAVDLIKTTDAIDAAHPTRAAAEAAGGADTMSGNAKADIMLGGVNNDDGLGDPEVDRLYGDRASPTSATIAIDGDDILLGDDGELDFSYGLDADRTILDLIRSYEDGLGGTDEISGDKGLDVAIGGTGGDTIYGDDDAASAADADLGDLLLGDNADVFLVAPLNLGTGADLKLVLDAAVKTIRTTDEEHPEYGGVDTISGNAGGDLIAGGVAGDFLYGDRETPNATTSADDGNDVILGDNGAFEWLSTGRLSEITGIDIEANNSDLYDKYHLNVADTDLTTLDLVTTEQPNSGGRDTIYGDEGDDFAFGGTDLDLIYGDDGNGGAEVEGSPNRDVLFGDHGRIYPQFSALLNFNSRNFFAIDTGDDKGGEGDIMYGEEGDDVMLGQQGDDRMWGGSGDDDMIGGHNVSGGYDELTTPDVVATLAPAGVNDLMDGGSGDDAMAGDNAIVWRRGDDVSPRFRQLADGSTSLYSTTWDTITTNVGTVAQEDPNGVVGRDIELLDHSDAVQLTPQGRFGNDVMAGGADSDVMFGELGNDLMQGDGNIGADDLDAGSITDHVSIDDSGSNPDTDDDLYFNIPEQPSDGDDYMEGNGGNDLMYGGLGQDDMIGGSSNLFGLAGPETLRPDGSDTMFGGAGIDIARNDIGDASEDATTNVITTDPTGHARDADFMMGDNANVYRVVNAQDAFLQFNYDQSSAYEERGDLRIVVRAMQQLDYTLGGADFAGGSYVNGAANADNGAADLMHGESGDDVIFSMTGSDVVFGDGQDDDIVGGYGNDWISGGTGQDGVIGDDGLVYTSRNSTQGEPLYGVAGLLDHDPSLKENNGNVLDEEISTPGNIQIAVINVSGELKKTADLVPMSYDHQWMASDDEFPDTTGSQPYADDIIFGGLGSDWLHGGSGDDAISGAEALEHAYVPTFDATGDPDGTLDLGFDSVGLPAVQNPGDVLAFNSEDLDGRHLNNRFRAGEFFLYDEYDPLRKIELQSDGTLWKPEDGAVPKFEFLLNFDQTEGVLRPGATVTLNGNQTITYPDVHDDGKDSVFGDTGNDWLVGGTGRDNLYGGWGNDLLNADDDLTTAGNEPKHGGALTPGANDVPDTHPYYEDRAYGGAGRDVLIGNTGGDRLIDWVGEYNSYLVPYAPFGQASVSRTMMPHLHEFLYALSAGDGADPTRANDTGADPARNGEPDAEMGLVLQKDVAWNDQTGAPSDPQAGNIPGGKRDVLRTANMNDGTLSGFAVDTGNFSVQNATLQVSAESLGLEATAVLPLDDQLPSYYEVLATVTAEKPIAGWKANAYIVFDYFDAEDFKFAGINVSTNEVEIGYHDAAGWHVVKDAPKQLKAGTYYNLLVAINGTNVTLALNNKIVLDYSFEPRIIDDYAYGLNMGFVGIGSDNARGTFDNFVVQRVPPDWTLQQSQDFGSGTGAMFGGNETGAWTLAGGRYAATAPGASLVDLGLSRGLETDAVLELSAILSTDGAGGFVFDRYAADDYKFVVLDADADQAILGHVTPKGGVAIDASFARTIDGGNDYALTLRLKGTSASVSLDGQALGGHVYNSVIVDGDFGLLAERGGSSFASATVRTSDSAFYAPESAMTATAAAATASGPVLTRSDLDAVWQFAVSQWTDVLGADSTLLSALHGASVGMAQLEGAELGFTEGNTVLIDTDAAGWGWFVDASPASSSEFRVRLDSNVFGAAAGSEAYGYMDLVTVVEHEVGHLLGFEHSDAGTYAVMNGTLAPGVRDLLEADGAPAFDAYAGYVDFGVDAGIDWQAASGGGWEIKLSPYDTGKPGKGTWSNFTPFELNSASTSGDEGFDRMGRDLLG